MATYTVTDLMGDDGTWTAAGRTDLDKGLRARYDLDWEGIADAIGELVAGVGQEDTSGPESYLGIQVAITTWEDALTAVAEHLRDARATEASIAAALADAVQGAHDSGMSKYRIVQVTGLARATVDKWAAGKR